MLDVQMSSFERQRPYRHPSVPCQQQKKKNKELTDRNVIYPGLGSLVGFELAVVPP